MRELIDQWPAGNRPSQFKQRMLRLLGSGERIRLGLARDGALAIVGVALTGVVALSILCFTRSLVAQNDRRPAANAPAENDREPESPPGHYRVSFRETPWKDVLLWYGRVMGQHIDFNVVPTGHFSYEGLRPMDQVEIAQLINAELLNRSHCLVQEGDRLSVQPADVAARHYADELRKDFMHGSELRKGPDKFESYFEIVDVRVVGPTKPPAPSGPAIAYVLKASRDFSAQEATAFCGSCFPQISFPSQKTGQPIVADGFAVLHNAKWLGTSVPALQKGDRIEVWQNRFGEWNARQPADLRVVIEGQIVGLDGKPVAEAKVQELLLEGGSDVPEGDDLSEFLNFVYDRELIVDKNGAFHVSLRHGTQFVRTAYLFAFSPRHAPRRIGPIAVDFEKPAVPLKIELKPGFSARMRLVLPDGKAIEKGEVTIAAQDELRAEGIPMAKLPIDGKPLSVANCPAGPLLLKVRVPGFAEQEIRDVRLAADKVTDVEVTIKQIVRRGNAAEVTGTVAVASGRAVPGANESPGDPVVTGRFARKQAEQLAAANLADQSTSLADAVRDFNADNEKRGQGQDQPPLTEEEVLKAIKRSDWKRDVPDVSEREFAAFKAVAETRRLPKGAELEVLTGLQPDAFTLIQLWSIRINMPALERAAGTVGFTIRDTKISEEKIDPKSVAWGKPGPDGLSLGLFLSPKKDKYEIGDRVQLRLFVRNEGDKVADGLTFMNITWPRTKDFTVTDQTRAKVPVRDGHEEWSREVWIAGGETGVRLDPGDVHTLRVPFELGIGGNGLNPSVGRVIVARPGQTLQLRVRTPNVNDRKDAEVELESGVVTITVTDAE